jgi:hypothetical protein
MIMPSVEQLEQMHTDLCRGGRLEGAHLILMEFRGLYNREMRNDINVYMAHERMKDRQFWLSVAGRSLPVRI